MNHAVLERQILQVTACKEDCISRITSLSRRTNPKKWLYTTFVATKKLERYI